MSGITGVDAFSKQLEAAGYNTVKIRNGEVNFTGYIGALDKNMQEKMVLTNDQQVQMRNQVAALFGNKNNMTHAQLKKVCAQQLGFEVNIGYEKTSYIMDNRNAASKGEQLSHGSVAVLTIKDPKSGQSIKIVDANGNGSIEIEEMFANELLQGISGDLKNVASSGGSSINMGQGLDKMQEGASLPTRTVAMGALLKQMEGKEFDPEHNAAEIAEKAKKTEEETGDILESMDDLHNEAAQSDDVESIKAKYEANGYKVMDDAGLRKYAESITKTDASQGTQEYEDAIEDTIYGLRLSYMTESLSDGSYAILS